MVGDEAVYRFGGMMLKNMLVVGVVASAVAVVAMSSMLAVVMFLEAKGVVDAGDIW